MKLSGFARLHTYGVVAGVNKPYSSVFAREPFLRGWGGLLGNKYGRTNTKIPLANPPPMSIRDCMAFVTPAGIMGEYPYLGGNFQNS